MFQSPKWASAFLVSVLSCTSIHGTKNERILEQEQLTTMPTNIHTSSPACLEKMTMSEQEQSIVLSFSDVGVKRGDEKPFVRCRIVGDIQIPKGFEFAPKTQVSAVVNGKSDQPGDLIGGLLGISFGQERGRDVRTATTEIDVPEQPLHLSVEIPQIHACAEDRTVPVNIHLEALINYRLDRESRVEASFNAITIPLIELHHAKCPPTEGE